MRWRPAVCRALCECAMSNADNKLCSWHVARGTLDIIKLRVTSKVTLGPYREGVGAGAEKQRRVLAITERKKAESLSEFRRRTDIPSFCTLGAPSRYCLPGILPAAMPREIITVQVGQCGNQIGSRFWDMVLQEHATYSRRRVWDDAMSTFFVNYQGEDMTSLPLNSSIQRLQARAVLVDMEEGVLNHVTRKSGVSELFDRHTQCISSQSGSGNNWAHGYFEYGRQYGGAIEDAVRLQAEKCDSLQSFFLMHSMGGGTGSGLGTYICQMLEDAFPDVYRFVTAVFPSADDDVVTSPYNSVLAMRQLVEHADCVLPMENSALGRLAGPLSSFGTASSTEKERKQEAFAAMNGIAATVLTHLTSSMRFEGKLNVDLNEITMNLVPYPRLHFLIPSLAPIMTPKMASIGHGPAQMVAPRRLNQMFTDAFTKEAQLIDCNPKASRYLACGLLVRGEAEISDINNNLARLRPELDFVPWNADAFKVGLCSFPPVSPRVPYALLGLANNCCMAQTCETMLDRFNKLFKRRVYMHHYEEYVGSVGDAKQLFQQSADCLQSLADDWKSLQVAGPYIEDEETEEEALARLCPRWS